MNWWHWRPITIRPAPRPFSRYGESALLLKTYHRGREGWFPLIMPVTTWIARQGGHHLGFPKFVAPSIQLLSDGENVRAKASGDRGGPFSPDIRFTPGLSRPGMVELFVFERRAVVAEQAAEVTVHLPRGECPFEGHVGGNPGGIRPDRCGGDCLLDELQAARHHRTIEITPLGDMGGKFPLSATPFRAIGDHPPDRGGDRVWVVAGREQIGVSIREH
jgi:hypothetical protein